MEQRGKYRTRTWFRRHLPYRLLWLAPKGRGDCGDHEWYRHTDALALCYHCEEGAATLRADDAITPDGIVSAPTAHTAPHAQAQ